MKTLLVDDELSIDLIRGQLVIRIVDRKQCWMQAETVTRYRHEYVKQFTAAQTAKLRAFLTAPEPNAATQSQPAEAHTAA